MDDPENANDGNSIQIPDPCILFRSASRAVTHLYDLVLAPTGMKSTQFIILHAIYEKSEIAQWELAKTYSISVEALSRRLAALRKSGHVEMRCGPIRNEHLYKLTDKGRRIVQAAIPYWARAQERFRQLSGANNWDLMLKAAQATVEIAHEAEMAKLPNKSVTQNHDGKCLRPDRHPFRPDRHLNLEIL
jgi:DNA-binding MarR family transcriptional regulator